MRKFFFLVSLLIFSAHTLLGQLKYISTKPQIESSIPKFAAKYNLPDTTKTKLLHIFLTLREQKDSLRAEHTKNGTLIEISTTSPFFIAFQALKAKREENLVKLLGEEMFKQLEQFGYEEFLIRREEALKVRNQSSNTPK